MQCANSTLFTIVIERSEIVECTDCSSLMMVYTILNPTENAVSNL